MYSYAYVYSQNPSGLWQLVYSGADTGQAWATMGIYGAYGNAVFAWAWDGQRWNPLREPPRV